MRTPERKEGGTAHVRIAARPAALSLALLAALAMDDVQAARLNYQFELTGLSSNNINLSENNQASESVLIPRLKFDFSEEGSAVEIKARGEVERRHYSNNRFDDETRSRFAGQLNWSLFPQRMNIVLEDYLSEESINFRDGRYPGNLQEVNIFIGGPSFYARFNDTTRLQLDLRAADTNAEVAQGFDSKRYSAAGVLQHDFNAASNVSLHLAGTRVDLDDAVSADYTRHDGFVRYQGNRRHVDYEFDLGRSRMNRSSTGDVSTSLARMDLRWEISPESRLRLRARKQFADEVQDLVVRLSDPDESMVPALVDASSSLVSAGVYRQKDAELDYRYTGERFGFRARPRYRTFDYIDSESNDRSERVLYLQASYRITPLTTVALNGTLRDRDFDNANQHDRDHVYSLGIEQQRTRHWGWRAEVLRNKRTSNQPDPEYRENAVYLTIWWKR